MLTVFAKLARPTNFITSAKSVDLTNLLSSIKHFSFISLAISTP